MTFKGYRVLKQTELLCLQWRLSNIFPYSALRLCYNLPVLKMFPLPLFLKVEHKLLHHIWWNSFVSAYEIFPYFLSLNSFLEYTYSLPKFEEEVEMREVAGSGVRNRLFAVLVEKHSDLAKWFPLRDADGCPPPALLHKPTEPALLCSRRSEGTQSYSRESRSLVLPQAGHGEPGRGTDPRWRGRDCWQSCQTADRQPTVHRLG